MNFNVYKEKNDHYWYGSLFARFVYIKSFRMFLEKLLELQKDQDRIIFEKLVN